MSKFKNIERAVREIESRPNATSLRILKLIRQNPEMSSTQIARKIGRPNTAGEMRVDRERCRLFGHDFGIGVDCMRCGLDVS